MYSLSKMDDVNGLLLERTENYGCYLMPRYYQGNWHIIHYCLSKEETANTDLDIEKEIMARNINYCLFIEDENIESRRADMLKLFPEMTLVKTVEPSYIDKLLHFLMGIIISQNVALISAHYEFGLIAGFVAGFGKELWDSRKGGSGFDFFDLWATTVGTIAGVIGYYLFI